MKPNVQKVEEVSTTVRVKLNNANDESRNYEIDLLARMVNGRLENIGDGRVVAKNGAIVASTTVPDHATTNYTFYVAENRGEIVDAFDAFVASVNEHAAEIAAQVISEQSNNN